MSNHAPLSHFILHAKRSSCILALLLVACAAVSTTPTPVPTSASDNPTAGAIARATRQAAATRSAAATARIASIVSAQTAQAAADASQTAEAAATGRASTQSAVSTDVAARATSQSIMAASAGWPRRVLEPFADNQLGWPVGLAQSPYLAVTATVAGGRYHWLAAITDLSVDGTYTNRVPAAGPALSDFAASVTVTFTQASANSETAFGLVFRQAGQGFGFFGLMPTGRFLVGQSRSLPVDQIIFERDPAFDARPGAPNRLAVVGLGPDLVFLINGQVVNQMTLDLAPRQGQIGLGVEALSAPDAAQVDFSDFEISAP